MVIFGILCLSFFRNKLVNMDYDKKTRIKIYILCTVLSIVMFFVGAYQVGSKLPNNDVNEVVDNKDNENNNSIEDIEIEIEKLFEDKSSYLDKTIGVIGYTPIEAISDENGTLMNYIYSEDWTCEMRVIGIDEALNGRDKVIIKGKVTEENGVIFIDAVNYTILDSTDIENKTDSNINDNSNEKTNMTTTKEKYENSLAYTIAKYGWKYAEDNNIKIHNFLKRTKLLKMYDLDILNPPIDGGVFMETKSEFKWFKKTGTIYKRTLEASNLIYYGDLNSDSLADGWGILFSFSNSDYTYSVIYIGEFKDGKYDGYGIQPLVETVQGMDMSYMRYLNKESEIVCSEDFYEGEFKDGLRSGKGNYFSQVGDIKR